MAWTLGGSGLACGRRPRDATNFRVVRTLSLVPGALTVAAVLALARSLAPSSVATEGLAGLFVATLPQFAFIHATVSNDP